MSRLRLAREIANQTGSSVSNAVSYVNRVGSNTARQTLRRAEDGVTWRVPVTVTATAGGVYGWREQKVREAEAIADQSESAMEALSSIIDSDLPDDLKAELADGFEGGSPNGSDDSPADRVEGFFESLSESFGGTETTLILMIVVVFVLIYGLNSLNPAMRGGVVR